MHTGKNNIMKKYSYVGIALIVLIFGIWAIPKIVEKFKPADLVSIGKVPAFSFTNQHGKTISNASYEGKVYVVEFFFTTCPTICPIMNRNLTKLQDAFYGRPDFGIASFTINPKHDTPRVLNKYAEKYKVSNPNWHFLTGDKEAIYALSNTGFSLYAGEDTEVAGGFEHSGMFALIDREGNIRCRKDDNGNPIMFYDGTDNTGVAMIKEDIEKLLND